MGAEGDLTRILKVELDLLLPLPKSVQIQEGDEGRSTTHIKISFTQYLSSTRYLPCLIICCPVSFFFFLAPFWWPTCSKQKSCWHHTSITVDFKHSIILKLQTSLFESFDADIILNLNHLKITHPLVV